MRSLTSAIVMIVAALLLFPLVVAASSSFYAETVYARSIPSSVETVISIRNQRTDVACTVTIQWVNANDTLAGKSGPYAIPPGDTVEFTTANYGEIIAPFILDVFRDTTSGFEGKALVFASCSGDHSPKLALQATLVINIDDDRLGHDYLPLSIVRPGGGVTLGD